MNEVSIIINGVRYDAVIAECHFNEVCRTCDLQELCSSIDGYISLCDICTPIGDDTHFKKSDKKFEI